MKSQILSRRPLLMTVIIGVVLLFVFILNILPEDQNGFEAQVGSMFVASKKEQVSIGRPVRLIISKIKVDAVVIYVGMTSQGAMDAPKGPNEVAWFNLGPRPGEIGSAVISGHYGWKNNIPAVFDNLNKLQKGDKLSIKDEKDTLTTFVVREIRILGENDDASPVFGSSDNGAHLNLITCGGVWDKTKKSYSKRLILFTDKE
ncbi:class F sortase [Candidatus Parcubacteria bacterium]|jgi:LPXTG-site transpeptidase (sortase) family protein|nr:MAG: class F sortase [Candidatus Parcubacteria bacterium]